MFRVKGMDLSFVVTICVCVVGGMVECFVRPCLGGSGDWNGGELC